MSRLTFEICCAYSGLHIGTLEYEVVAGHMPYLSHWNGLVAYHPIFSLDRHRLLAFARSEWNRLAKKSEDGEASDGENNILRVCFLAMLHSLDSIEQTYASLPPTHIVQSNMQRLFVLSYWHHYLDSKRFRFPEFRINKLNANGRFENVSHYLDACFGVKEAYETGVNEQIEEEKVRAAERALAALRNSWVTPVSKKQLWSWVRAHLPPRYSADGQGWMQTIFLGNERKILSFDADEISLMEEIITCECPPGTGIMKAVRDRMDEIKQIYKDHKEAFSVDFSEYEEETDPVLAAMNATPAKPPEPRESEFATKVLYIKAHAAWYLKCRAIEERSKKSEGGKL